MNAQRRMKLVHEWQYQLTSMEREEMLKAAFYTDAHDLSILDFRDSRAGRRLRRKQIVRNVVRGLPGGGTPRLK